MTPTVGPPALEGALAWADQALDRRGLARTGPAEAHLDRPWSTVWRLPLGQSACWLKKNAPGCAYEGAVLRLLTEAEVPHALRPWAVDVDRGLLLSADHGRTLREWRGGSRTIRAHERLLASYADLQRRTEPLVDALLAAGVPDHRPTGLPSVRARLIAASAAAQGAARLGPTDVVRLRGRSTAYAEQCAELDGLGIASSLQHNDLHDANAFPVVDGSGALADVVVFDFGDAVVSHPFASLLVALRSAAHHLDLTPGSPGLARLRDAYLEPWTTDHARADLDRAVELAARVGTVSRADAWRRALAGSRPEAVAEFADAVPGWLLEEFEPAVL